MLGAFATAFHAVQPAVVPGFALAWLELISHRAFMPALLNSKPAQKGWMLMHRLLIDLFVFMEPFLRRSTLTNAIRSLYKGALRVLLVLLHGDAPADPSLPDRSFRARLCRFSRISLRLSLFVLRCDSTDLHTAAKPLPFSVSPSYAIT